MNILFKRATLALFFAALTFSAQATLVQERSNPGESRTESGTESRAAWQESLLRIWSELKALGRGDVTTDPAGTRQKSTSIAEKIKAARSLAVTASSDQDLNQALSHIKALEVKLLEIESQVTTQTIRLSEDLERLVEDSNQYGAIPTGFFDASSPGVTSSGHSPGQLEEGMEPSTLRVISEEKKADILQAKSEASSHEKSLEALGKLKKSSDDEGPLKKLRPLFSSDFFDSAMVGVALKDGEEIYNRATEMKMTRSEARVLKNTRKLISSLKYGLFGEEGDQVRNKVFVEVVNAFGEGEKFLTIEELEEFFETKNSFLKQLRERKDDGGSLEGLSTISSTSEVEDVNTVPTPPAINSSDSDNIPLPPLLDEDSFDGDTPPPPLLDGDSFDGDIPPPLRSVSSPPRPKIVSAPPPPMFMDGPPAPPMFPPPPMSMDGPPDLKVKTFTPRLSKKDKSNPNLKGEALQVLGVFYKKDHRSKSNGKHMPGLWGDQKIDEKIQIGKKKKFGSSAKLENAQNNRESSAELLEEFLEACNLGEAGFEKYSKKLFLWKEYIKNYIPMAVARKKLVITEGELTPKNYVKVLGQLKNSYDILKYNFDEELLKEKAKKLGKKKKKVKKKKVSFFVLPPEGKNVEDLDLKKIEENFSKCVETFSLQCSEELMGVAPSGGLGGKYAMGDLINKLVKILPSNIDVDKNNLKIRLNKKFTSILSKSSSNLTEENLEEKDSALLNKILKKFLNYAYLTIVEIAEQEGILTMDPQSGFTPKTLAASVGNAGWKEILLLSVQGGMSKKEEEDGKIKGIFQKVIKSPLRKRIVFNKPKTKLVTGKSAVKALGKQVSPILGSYLKDAMTELFKGTVRVQSISKGIDEIIDFPDWKESPTRALMKQEKETEIRSFRSYQKKLKVFKKELEKNKKILYKKGKPRVSKRLTAPAAPDFTYAENTILVDQFMKNPSKYEEISLEFFNRTAQQRQTTGPKVEIGRFEKMYLKERGSVSRAMESLIWNPKKVYPTLSKIIPVEDLNRLGMALTAPIVSVVSVQNMPIEEDGIH